MVGETGFEPATSCSQSRRATGLRHSPTLDALRRPGAEAQASSSVGGAGTPSSADRPRRERKSLGLTVAAAARSA